MKKINKFFVFFKREARLELFSIQSKGSEMALSTQDWDVLAEKTQGYSGSDISTLTLGALFEPIRDLQNATHWKQNAGKIYNVYKQ